MKSMICLILVYMAASLDCSYQHDYTFFPEIEGWLKLQKIPLSWSDARLRCLLEGGRLASPLDTGLQKAMQTLITQVARPQYMVYTGIHAIFSKGEFFSLEGVPLSKIPIRWADSEPHNFFDQMSCLVMLQGGSVANVNCNDTHPSICYRKLPKNPVLNECGTVDNDYKLDPQTKKCYKFHTIPRTWGQAVMACSAEGGHLVVINNETEANVVKEIFDKHPTDSMLGIFNKDIALIGFHGWGENVDWRTIDDLPLDDVYNKFDSDEPNNEDAKQFCGAMNRNGLLNDIWCDRKFPFICEKSPGSLVSLNADPVVVDSILLY